MKAARLHRYGSPLVVEEVPTPEVDDDAVLVKVEGAGFCHSDLHVIDGEIPVLPRRAGALPPFGCCKTAALRCCSRPLSGATSRSCGK